MTDLSPAPRAGWLHCSSGVSGDMLIGALADTGVPLGFLQAAVDAVAPAPIRLEARRVQRAGLAATKVDVLGTESAAHRTWSDIDLLITDAQSHAFAGSPGAEPPGAGESARRAGLGVAREVFRALALAEGRVHGVPAEEIHFHEVGALDAIADVVAVCAGFAYLGLESLTVSPVALGGGTVRAAHGFLPVPGPAVVELLKGAPTYGGPVDKELTTPTGAALIATLATGWGGQPAMRVSAQAFGAGTRDLPDRPNVVRLVLGIPDKAGQQVARNDNRRVSDRDDETRVPERDDQPRVHQRDGEPQVHQRDGEPRVPERDDGGHVVAESNVDDLDPRVWPGVLQALLRAGADDAWLVPILMKKGRPAYTLKVLSRAGLLGRIRAVVFAQTSAIGLRWAPVEKVALDREFVTVTVDGKPIRVKVARDGGRLVNAQPEWDDVARAAAETGTPAKVVLARAVARFHLDQPGSPQDGRVAHDERAESGGQARREGDGQGRPTAGGGE